MRKSKTNERRDAVLGTLCFGTAAQRNIYPLDTPKNRLGNKVVPCRGQPELGPGCYNTQTASNEASYCSKKGYSCGARTEARFPPPPRCTPETTPAAHPYQAHVNEPKKCRLSAVPFNTSAKRVNKKWISSGTPTPGAGTYDHDVERNRQVCNKWPRMFDRPIARKPIILPVMPDTKALRTEMIEDRDLKRHRNRVAYLSLYY